MTVNTGIRKTVSGAPGWLLRSALPALAATLSVAPASAGDGPAEAELANFCTTAQQMVAATAQRSANVVYADLEAFIKSKASIRPLVTRQFVHYDEESLPRMVSCKVKTSDILVLEYGEAAAGFEGRCSSVNGLTLQRVTAALESAAAPLGEYDAVVLETDEVGVSGVNWLKPYRMLWREGDTLHILAKALRVDWHDDRFAKAPARFRGTHYCHLVAPSYLRRVLTGEVGVPAPDM